MWDAFPVLRAWDRQCLFGSSSSAMSVTNFFLQKQKPCTDKSVCAYLAAKSFLHYRLNNRGLLRATAVTWGWNGQQNRESAQKVDSREEMFPTGISVENSSQIIPFTSAELCL